MKWTSKEAVLRKIIVKEYDLDEATANWHIKNAQQWAVQARKAPNCANGEENENR